MKNNLKLKSKLAVLGLFIIVVGLFFINTNKIQALSTNYYVDGASIGGTCNNNNPGTITQPWCTIQKATSATSPVQAGDTIYVRAGTYNGTVDMYKSGTLDNPITLSAYQNETVNLNGSIRIDAFAIGGYVAENWYFKKLNVTNPNGDGFHFTNGNHTGQITIDSCNISHNKANGITTGWGNNQIGTIVIKNNIIQYNDQGDEEGNSGIAAYAYGTYIIQNNNISYNGDPDRVSAVNKGITFYQGANRCSYCLVENNFISHNLETGMDFNGNNGIIRNNQFIANGQLDTEAGEYGDGGLAIQGNSSNNRIYNNVIASSGGYDLSVMGNANKFISNIVYKDFNYTATPVPASHYYSAVIIWNGSGHVFRYNTFVNTLTTSGRQYDLMTYEFDPSLYTNQTRSNNIYYSSYAVINPGAAYIKINTLPNLAALQATGNDRGSIFATTSYIEKLGSFLPVPPVNQK